MEQLDNFWMQHAIDLAKKAERQGEVPVGAVLIRQQEIIGEGWNSAIMLNDPTAHAEIQAIRSAGVRLQNYRLPETTLYVTLEPCVMCAGALIHARISRLVFGTCDLKAGAIVSVFQILDSHKLNHRVAYQANILQPECIRLLQDFFQRRRQEIKRSKTSWLPTNDQAC